jgi:hypothetical protein
MSSGISVRKALPSKIIAILESFMTICQFSTEISRPGCRDGASEPPPGRLPALAEVALESVRE